MDKMLDDKFMAKAISKAWKHQLQTYPNPAVGATIVKDGKVITTKAHHKAGGCHAELLAIKHAYVSLSSDKTINAIKSPELIHSYLVQHHRDIFCSCEIYTTLEPCSHIGKTPSCAKLIAMLKFNKVFIGSKDSNPIAQGGANMLKKAGNNVATEVSKDSCDKLLLPFKIWQNKSGGFCFFKLAMRADGSIDRGQISSLKAQKWVHKLRSMIDLLVIGGTTVRTDRPILDTRKYKKSLKNPDVVIYSKQTNFDQTVKLFDIKDRNITISNDITSAIKSKFVMIEGGFDMLKATKNYVDMIVLIVNTTTISKNYHKFIAQYEILGKVDTNQDSIYYLV